jgi:hypothetical protein
LGRDSLEGVARYRYSKKPKVDPKYKRLTFRIDKDHEYRGLYVTPTLPKGGGRNDIEIDTQVEIFNTRTNNYDAFRPEDLPSKSKLEKLGYDLRNKEMRFYGKVEEVLKAMKAKGMDVEIQETAELRIDKISGLIPVLVTCPLTLCQP